MKKILFPEQDWIIIQFMIPIPFRFSREILLSQSSCTGCRNNLPSPSPLPPKATGPISLLCREEGEKTLNPGGIPS